MTFETEWRRRFERFAESYQEDYQISGWSEEGLTARLAVFTAAYERAMPATSCRVLDLGCGPGTYGRWLCDRGDHVVGLDYSWPSLKQAQGKDGTRRNRPAYTQGEAYRLPFRAGVFDVVLCVGVLQTLSDERQALAELTRVLKPRGLLIVDALNARGLSTLVQQLSRKGGGRVVRYSPLGLRRLVRGLGYPHPHFVPVVILPKPMGRLYPLAWRAGIFALPLAHSFFLIAQREA